MLDQNIFDLVFDFVTLSDYAGDDHVLLDNSSKEKLKKYGNNIYYDAYFFTIGYSEKLKN